MEYINGKNLQKKFLNELKQTVSLLGIKPTLAVISIDNNKINDIFFKQIKQMIMEVGYEIQYHHYADISQATLLKLIEKLNKDPKITSIMIELPIPKHLDFNLIRNAISKEKDIEGISDINRIKYQNKEGSFVPNTVLGIKMLLESYAINVKQKNVVIINRSDLIGIPLFYYFQTQDCTITMCHQKTRKLENFVKEADIVISATGSPNFLPAKLFKKDSIVIDIGLNYLNGKLCGDIDLTNEEEFKGKYFVKSIGGVGPMTITAIAYSVLKSYYLSQKDKVDSKFLFPDQ